MEGRAYFQEVSLQGHAFVSWSKCRLTPGTAPACSLSACCDLASPLELTEMPRRSQHYLFSLLGIHVGRMSQLCQIRPTQCTCKLSDHPHTSMATSFSQFGKLRLKKQRYPRLCWYLGLYPVPAKDHTQVTVTLSFSSKSMDITL